MSAAVLREIKADLSFAWIMDIYIYPFIQYKIIVLTIVAHIILYKSCITSQEKEAGELATPTDQWRKQASSRFLDKKLQQQVFR